MQQRIQSAVKSVDGLQAKKTGKILIFPPSIMSNDLIRLHNPIFPF